METAAPTPKTMPDSNITQGQPQVGTSAVFCPCCGAKAKQDNNALWCDFCGKLWPKGHGYEEEGFQAADLRNRAQGSRGIAVGPPFDSADRSFRDGPSPDSSADDLRRVLRIVMEAAGMFEDHSTPTLGKCSKCYGHTIAATVHVCRKCAREMGHQILGQNA